MSTAKKMYELQSPGVVPFVSMWVTAYAIGWTPIALIPGIGLFLLQTWLIDDYLKLHIRGWVWVSLSLIAVIIGLFLNYLFISQGFDDRIFAIWRELLNLQAYEFGQFREAVYPVFSLGLVIFPVFIPQTILLWKHVKLAWLWLLVGFTSTVLLGILVGKGSLEGMLLTIPLSLVLQGGITCITMWYLAKNQRRGKKRKNEATI